MTFQNLNLCGRRKENASKKIFFKAYTANVIVLFESFEPSLNLRHFKNYASTP